MNQDTPTTAGFNAGNASDNGVTRGTSGGSTSTCTNCGAELPNKGLEQFLGRLGISEEMVNNLRGSLQNVDVEEYLNTARDFLKDSGNKATSFTKENPGKVAAGVAVLAVGAGLLISALNRD